MRADCFYGVLAVYDAMSDDMDPFLESRIDQRLLAKAGRARPQDGFKGRKTVNEVLDRTTVMTLYKMISDGVVSGVDGAVGAGKESLLFRGIGEDGADVALKLYLVSTSNFKKRIAYIEGDPRFARFRRKTRDIVYLWAQKEFRNLRQAHDAGVRVPRPIKASNNVLAMEFIGEGGRPAPLLMNSSVDRQDYLEATGIIRRLYQKAGLVHGDYSEYNIFKTDGGLVPFDLGSAVDRRHPGAAGFLERDINNINRFFAKRRVQVTDTATILSEMK